MMTGAIPSKTAVVERLAPMAMLAPTTIVTASSHATISHHDLNGAFTMTSTFLWGGVDVLEQR